MVNRLFNSLVKASLILTAGYCGMAAADADNQVTETQKSQYVPAKFIENFNSILPNETARSSRLEGWSLLSYMVGADGKPQAIEVIDSEGLRDRVERSTRFVEKMRFKPAMSDGKAVPSSQSLFLRHTMGAVGGGNEGITPGFNSRYERAYQYLVKKAFDKAAEELKELRDNNAKNLSEQALDAYIHSIYYFMVKDWPAYGREVEVSTRLREYLPTKYAIKTTQNQIEYLKFQGLLSEAIVAVNSLKNIENATVEDSLIEQSVAGLVEQMKAKATVEVKAKLNHLGAWQKSVFHDTLNLQVSSGRLDRVELRCRDGIQSFEANNQMDIKIHEKLHGCELMLKGEVGSEITITGQGNVAY